jgi:hypothetical protein
MHPFKFAISLRIFSRTVDPLEMCDELGLKPKWSHRLGDSRKNPKGLDLGGIHDQSYCSFALERKDDEELHDSIGRISDELKRHQEFFHRVTTHGGRVEFFIGWYSSGNTGDTLSHSLLKKIGDLNIDLAFDVYGDAPRKN